MQTGSNDRVSRSRSNLTSRPYIAGFVFTNHYQEYFLSFSPRLCKFESNTTSDWLTRMVQPFRKFKMLQN